MTSASVLIPIHDKPTTLPLTVDTVLRQSVTDLEVLLIGDGVTDAVRDVVAALVAGDERVRFLDFPKGPHHGERYRHDAVLTAESDAIFYLCDDDLLLPDHVADLLELLEDHDLVQCLNGYVTPSGEVRLYAADLSDPDCVALHVSDEVRYNSVSITGTAHTRAAYLRTTRWDTTPSDQWPDHWQFRKLMGLPGFRGATSSRMTALQFPTSANGRDTWTDEARAAEVEPWHGLVTSPGAQAEIDRRVREGMLAQLIEERQEHAHLSRVQRELMDALAQVETLSDDARRRAEEEIAGLWDEITTLREHVARLAELRVEREARIESLRAKLAVKNETIARLRSRVGRKG